MGVLEHFSNRNDLRQRLIELYFIHGLSQTEIAKIFGVSQRRIYDLFKELGLIARNKSDALSLHH